MIQMLSVQILSLLLVGLGARWIHPNISEINLKNALAQSPRLIVSVGIATLLAILAFSISWFDSWATQFPLKIQRDAMRLVWLFSMLLIGILSGYALAIAFRTQDKERWVLFIAVILLEFGVAQIFYPSISTLRVTQSAEVTPDGVTLQSTPSTCAAASLVNIARHFQIDLTESEAIRLMGTTRSGTTPGQTRYGIKRVGLGYRMIQSRMQNSIDNLNPPAILWMDDSTLGKEKHAVVYFGKQNEGYEIWDPLKGKLFMRIEEINALWHGNGIEVFLEETSAH